MVLSPLTGSCSHGDNTLMELWGLECLPSYPWARLAVMRRSHNVAKRGGPNGAPLNLQELRHPPQCISTMVKTQEVEGSASPPLPPAGIRAHWSFAWRSAPHSMFVVRRG